MIKDVIIRENLSESHRARSSV